MNRCKQIKDILIKLAVEDKLPTDLNELDERIFDPVFFHTLVPCELKDPYISLEFEGGQTCDSIPFRVQVKLDNEGVVVDLFIIGKDEPSDSIWKLYTDMEDGEDDVTTEIKDEKISPEDDYDYGGRG